ncbi:membrane-anchored protein [Burkholderia pseudomallei]|uniref:DUF2167 domain-containing protein n=1 Tax=Burkholderia pseudomallei TaxID=28450 RepID=UPI0009B50169|nr:DUF2167 domain-containing protein [Burkholderia pseudomallei]AYX28678.1 DUF2167 domain-containing protein [Burkholderia pseudomallei]MCD4547543.1 DUF2167 domain-containing protein [Burkholderia pseudomallei]CAJ2974141.1 membrane-anchored protein [Burkholderia pseudomallei]CAJ3219501.1 membrane-anchored protein [Burkholderia pseudomallei]CAJ3237391.1 membrane-anchored protein [Burkholderia pseudomallei]
MEKVSRSFALGVCVCASLIGLPVAAQDYQDAGAPSESPQWHSPQPGQAQPSDSYSNPETQHVVQVLRSLHWIHGPKEVSIETQAQFTVPQGFMFLNKDDTDIFMELQQNPASHQAYLFAPEDLSWFGLLAYEDTGHVPDTDAIDADALLQSIKTGTDAGNQERLKRGWSTITIQGWRAPPHYDTETKRLEWAIAGIDSQHQVPVINFNTRILGRTGLLSAELVTAPDSIDSSVLGFKTALRGIDFVPGQSYAEFKNGDKVAEYGLGALIVGGTAAAVAKSGAGKWLLKGLVAIGIAVLAGVRRMFGRKKTS